jgi:hypothetical protein
MDVNWHSRSFQAVKRQGYVTDNSSSSNFGVKNQRSYTFRLLYAVMACEAVNSEITRRILDE